MDSKRKLNNHNNDLLTDIFTKIVVLPGENRKELNKIKAGIENDLKPEGAIEEILCSKIVADTWKLRRFYAFEKQTLKRQQTPQNQNVEEVFQIF